jgi:TrpR-related protein YerC/YecD
MESGHSDDIDLFTAILALENHEEALSFFKDLCTRQEIGVLQERWRVCQLLERGDLSYRDIHRLTGASLVTIGRVARFLKEEEYGGYKNMLKKLKTRRK